MISVIVTEYKKRGYLIHALRSVFNQTLNRDRYEVIVVKNYEDKEVDDYARKNGAKIIVSDEKWLGPKIAQGLEEAKGDIISLLEDDDIFKEEKLEIVNNIFKEEKVGEIRNEAIYIDSYNNILFNPNISNNIYKYYINRFNYKYKKYLFKLGFNSNISINKEFIDNDIKHQKISVDMYLAFSAICKSNDKNVLLYGNPLTYYRLHSENASEYYRLHSENASISPKSQTLEKKVEIAKSYLEDHERLYNKFYNCGKEIRNSIKFLILDAKFIYYLLELYSTVKQERLELQKNFKFSVDDKIFLLNPFNKPQLKFIIRGILAFGFLSLPPGLRFHLFKFFQRQAQ